MTIMVKDTEINELDISYKEIKALEKCNSEIRYNYTLKRIADTETLWSIVDQDGCFAIQTYNNKKFLPIWSSKEYAQVFCANEWNSYKWIAITLDSFEDSVIDFICQNGVLLNVFPTKLESLGKIIDLNTFAEDLSKFLEDYQ